MNGTVGCVTTSDLTLGLADEDLVTCVGCGLCLPHCPTYRVTGEERFSPRGRIALMRAVQWDRQSLDSEMVESLSTCIQCRGCEPACPSGVPYGRLIEGARSTIESDRRTRRNPRWLRPLLGVLRHHLLLVVGSRALAFGQRIGLARRLPRIPLRIGPRLAATSTTPDVWIFTGCVMDAWSRPTHRSLARLLEASGSSYGVMSAPCCGALHQHAGFTDDARSMAHQVIASTPGNAPILVDSAGCGAALKDYGHLLDTDEARAFAARVLDAHEWFAARLDRLPPAHQVARSTVILQEPCHLRHVQKVHQSMRQIVQHVADVVDTEDDGLCCGAGGAYSILEPQMAGAVRDRKVGEIARVDRGRGLRVVSANPGCAQHLSAAGIEVIHPLDLLAASIIGETT